MHKLPQLKKDIWEALREKNRKMYLILVAEDNDLQRESENDCRDYISKTVVKCDNDVKTQTEKRKEAITIMWNNIVGCLKSFNKITSKYHNDG